MSHAIPEPQANAHAQYHSDNPDFPAKLIIFTLFIGLGVSSLAVDCLVGAKARWSCVLVNFNQLIGA